MLLFMRDVGLVQALSRSRRRSVWIYKELQMPNLVADLF